MGEQDCGIPCAIQGNSGGGDVDWDLLVRKSRDQLLGDVLIPSWQILEGILVLMLN